MKAPRAFLNRRSSRRTSYAAFGLILALCVPLGIAIRRDNYINAEIADVASGGLVFNANASARSVVLMGDSNASMYGKLIREVCEELQLNLRVISVAGGDPLPSTTGRADKLWYDSLAVVRAIKPDYLVLAYAWAQQLRADRSRLAAALKHVEPYAGRIVLINQPPTLPKEASRLAIRNGSQPPYVEEASHRGGRTKSNRRWVRRSWRVQPC